ncbi:MAG: gamma-glutamyltransferase [Dehalococcoidia bacterium]
MPLRGASAVAVPGYVDAMCAIHARFATKPLAELLAPAIAYAHDGFALSQGVARVIAGTRRVLESDPGCTQVFLSNGAPSAGSTLRQPGLARTLEAIAFGGREAFAMGETGKRIADHLCANGGKMSQEDLAQDQAVWGEPLSISYRDATVYEQPLPSQGFMTLEALNIVEELGLGRYALVSPEAVHPAVEALRMTFDDRNAHAGDPEAVDVPIERLLSKAYAAEQRARISERAGLAAPSSHGDTTSFAVADGFGNVVTYIQSTFQPWGAAVLIPGTGVMMNDRMTGFSLDPASPNVLRPGRRTVHTLNSWIVERDDGRVFAGGTPGADTQIQVNMQVIAALLDWDLGAQSAIDAPKWAMTTHEGRRLATTLQGDGLVLERRFPDETLVELARRGHPVVRGAAWETALSRCQVVGRQPDGSLLAASDLRAEGAALAC